MVRIRGTEALNLGLWIYVPRFTFSQYILESMSHFHALRYTARLALVLPYPEQDITAFIAAHVSQFLYTVSLAPTLRPLLLAEWCSRPHPSVTHHRQSEYVLSLKRQLPKYLSEDGLCEKPDSTEVWRDNCTDPTWLSTYWTRSLTGVPAVWSIQDAGYYPLITT